MSRFFGKVGFIYYEETEGSVFVERTVEKPYSGDVIKLSKRFERSDKLTDDLNLSNEIRIVADKFAYEHFPYIRYVNYFGANWKVTSASIDEHPRITLQIGGVYNGSEGPKA
jgi:hypothetical protein